MKTIDITAVLTGAQLMVSMVETRRAARNGDGVDASAPQELAQIERQLGKLESLDGQSAEVRQEIDDLRERVSLLRQEMSHREAWIKTELARHPQRPYFLDYVEKISPILARFMEIAVTRTIPPWFVGWRAFTVLKCWCSGPKRAET